MSSQVDSLRSLLELLNQMDGQLIETDVEVDRTPTIRCLSSYRRRRTVMGDKGRAMIFNNVKAIPTRQSAMSVLASGKRVGALLGTEPENARASLPAAWIFRFRGPFRALPARRSCILPPILRFRSLAGAGADEYP